jgi:hypothetical protein
MQKPNLKSTKSVVYSQSNPCLDLITLFNFFFNTVYRLRALDKVIRFQPGRLLIQLLRLLKDK